MRLARSETEVRESHRRLFFALWPQDAFQVTLAEATRNVMTACGGRAVPPENFHITLAFLGSVPERRLVDVVAIAGRLAGEIERPPLQLALDGIEYWKKAKIVCATASATPPGATELADALKSQLTTAGLTPDLKSSWSVGSNNDQKFRPHVTLARKAHHPPRLTRIAPVTWSFTDFVLVDSKTLPEGSVYTVLERFPFGQ